MAVIDATEKSFEAEVLKSDLPVLVDFWAEWCGPCKAIAPVIKEIAEELEGKLKVVKVNIEDAQELAGKYNVMSIPMMIVFKGGEQVEQIMGAVSKDVLLEKINTKIN
ncbi:Thioredoxin [hydrothermal vent metagenome]|uniref:Thioredoxin n=1 Tax=hydrothermal vent metagenome TaxID=652676 RepID=A0A3B1DRH5_9ZZZZ